MYQVLLVFVLVYPGIFFQVLSIILINAINLKPLNLGRTWYMSASF